MIISSVLERCPGRSLFWEVFFSGPREVPETVDELNELRSCATQCQGFLPIAENTTGVIIRWVVALRYLLPDILDKRVEATWLNTD